MKRRDFVKLGVGTYAHGRPHYIVKEDSKNILTEVA